VLDEVEYVPNVTSLLLNSTDHPLNRTDANLMAWASAIDEDGDDIKIYYNWYRNETSITVLNLLMSQDAQESNDNQTVYDISRFGNDGRLGAAAEADSAEPVFNRTGGYDGFGAYEFDGEDDYVNISADSSLDVVNNSDYTVEVWLYPNNIGDVWSEAVLQHFSGDGTGRTIIQIGRQTPAVCSLPNEYFSVIGGVGTCSGVSATSAWTHVVVVVTENGTTDNVSIYINGTFRNSSLRDKQQRGLDYRQAQDK
jgi:hypothetical protein